MSSLGLRVGRLALLRLGGSVPRAAGRGQHVIPAHLLRMVNVQQQQQARNLILSSSRCIQAQNHEANYSADKENKGMNSAELELDKNLYKMDMDLRRYGRINPVELNEAIQFIRRTGVCSGTQALLLLTFCGSACTDDRKQDRRRRVEELIPTLYSTTKLDVSHFNALLKLHMDNGEKVEVSKFLTDMEKAGCVPNRVTYNYLIGLYCMDGNITGATTVLEQMKEEGMAINESVFHSLLYGHVYNKDKESTLETLDIMNSSSLLPGTETYSKMLQAAAKVQDWDRVEELLQEAVEKDIRLDAGDHFQLLITLCENGMGAKAETLTAKIPKQTGFFQELRCALPQIIFAGNIELAFWLYEDFVSSLGAQNISADQRNRTFFTRLVIKSDAEPEKAAKMIIKMYDAGHTVHMGHFVMSCIESNRTDYIQALEKEMSERPEENKIKIDGEMTNFVIMQGNNKGLQSCANAMNIIQSYGGYVHLPRVVRAMIHRNYDADKMTPSDCINLVGNELQLDMKLKNILLNNQMITYLLSRNSNKENQELNGFLLFTMRSRFDPQIVKTALVNNALATKSTNVIINMLFKLKLDKDQTHERELKIYEEILMAMTEESGLIELMKTTLKELNKFKIGVPRAVADNLTARQEDNEIKELLSQAVKDYEDDSIWTVESEQQFLEMRKEQHREENKKLGFRSPVPENRRYQGNNFAIPEDVNEMFAIKKVIAKRGDMNYKLEDNIIKALAAANKPSEAIIELEKVIQNNDTFVLVPVTVNEVVRSFLRLNKPEEALEFLNKYGIRHFLSTIIDIVVCFAQKGDHNKVMELLQSIPNMEQKTTLNKDSNEREYIRVLREYSRSGDIENLEKTFQFLEEILSGNRNSIKYLLTPLIEIYLEKDDIKGALAAFEKYARKYRCAPARDILMTRLVQEENVDGLQKVIDMSISVIGEELTLYSLTCIFLQQDRRSQAKKMLETPGLMYNEKEINRIIKSFIDQGRLDCLEDLVVMSKNIFGCDRDHLFLAWVKAEAKNPNKVEEIWMQIQDEGHAPSLDLKTQVARAFHKADRTIPFDTTGLKLDGTAIPVAKPDAKPVAKPVQVEKAAEKTEGNKRTDLTEEEIKALVQSLKSETISEEERSTGLSQLIMAKRYEQAAQLLTDNQFEPKNLVRKLLKELFKNERNTLDKFVENMPNRDRAFFRVENYLNPFHPTKIVDKVKAASADNLIPMDKSRDMEKVQKAIKKDPSIKEELESLSSSGHIPASIMLGRLAAMDQDAEALVRYWNMDTREIKNGYAVNMQNFDHLRWMCDTLNEDRNLFEMGTNLCLESNPKQFKQIWEFAVQRGLALSSLKNSNLKRIMELDDFPNKDEIERILKERKQKIENQ